MVKNDWHIGLIEDEEKFRKYFGSALSEIREISNLSYWKSAEEIIHDNVTKIPDIFFVDINLVHMNGLDLIIILRQKYPDSKIVVISSLNSDENIFRALKLGAIGYLWKNELDSLPEVLKIVMNGGGIISPTIALRVLNSFSRSATEIDDKQKNRLTDREKQVLQQLVKGHTIQKTADIINISEHTARTHVRSIYKKLEVTNRVELLQKATNEYDL